MVTTCNKIINDAETFHSQIIQEVLNDANPQARTEFAKEFNIPVENILTHKFPGYPVQKMKRDLSDNIDLGFNKIHAKCVKRSKQQTTILTHNNDPEGGGRHIAPNNVNISSVTALNLVCDVIEGSYQINLEQSNQAQQGYILYSFAPTAPPGFLIVEDPVNPVYMQCHNKSLTRINFRLTDQSNNLIDLRGEVLAISLFVKS